MKSGMKLNLNNGLTVTIMQWFFVVYGALDDISYMTMFTYLV